jgi:iron complex outermembrane receptor protein
VLPNGTNVTDTYSIPLVPKWNYQLGAIWSQPVGMGTLEVSANWNWRSRQWSSITSDQLSARRSYGLLDGRIALKDVQIGGGTSMEFAVWGRNLTDSKYWNSGINLSLFTVRQWADPRSFGGEVRLRF